MIHKWNSVHLAATLEDGSFFLSRVVGFLCLTFRLAALPETWKRVLALSQVSGEAARRNVRHKKPISVTKTSILLECPLLTAWLGFHFFFCSIQGSITFGGDVFNNDNHDQTQFGVIERANQLTSSWSDILRLHPKFEDSQSPYLCFQYRIIPSTPCTSMIDTTTRIPAIPASVTSFGSGDESSAIKVTAGKSSTRVTPDLDMWQSFG